ncbi:MAG: transcriptional repressor LexA [Anaeromicrobium sp.]|jgi:repressor LexA|uniref:transcriptional repressor LexA n=1 Tax=Anaeromicrobium sp. TaxID=1929132 RepID=UPI0025ED25C6|nr:transcriptional repressor LexA [Anaeromicrobium sp.]MCT4596202.1 transcriptional repressor LexA [Anaeromicrobium sp.]
MKDELTNQQRKILDFLKYTVSEKGYPPSVREICVAVGLKSTSTVHNHLSKLEKKGYIRKDPTKPRAIEILDTKDGILVNTTTVNVPVVGKVTAGAPILAVQNVEDSFPVPKNFVDDNNYFMLTIKGTSMIEAGILDGDYVLIKQQQTACNGDIVVAMLEDEATVKRFFKESDYIRLQPENHTMEPIICNDVKILGLVKGVFRKM